MNVGELRDKIDICIKVENDGPVDNLEPSYIDVASNIWAKKTKLLGKESIALGLDHNVIQVNFIIRSRSGIDELMYIRHKDTIYNIVGFKELETDRNYVIISTVKKQVII